MKPVGKARRNIFLYDFLLDFSLYVLIVFTDLVSDKSTIPFPLACLFSSISKGHTALYQS